MSTIHEQLTRQRITPKRQLSTTFTNNVLSHIQGTPASRWRLPGLQEFGMKLTHLPKYALVALAITAVGTSTAGAYAAYQWLTPKITVTHITPTNDDGRREFAVDVKDCGVIIGGDTVRDGSLRYEVDKKANLSDEQIIKSLKESCNYQQLLELMHKRWDSKGVEQGPPQPGTTYVTVQPGGDGDNVINNPAIGRVTALQDGKITITSKVYAQYDGPNAVPAGQPIPDVDALTQHFPEGKLLTRTFDLDSNYELLDEGKPVGHDQLRVGDTVFFMSQISRPIASDGTWGKPTQVKVTQLTKADIDTDYVQTMSVGNPAIVNAIARLDACAGNGGQLCLAAKTDQFRFTFVYSSTTMQELFGDDAERFAGNEKYARKDINDSNMKAEYFHAIEGRVRSIDGTKLTLQSRGSNAQIFSVTLPYDAVKKFNADHKQQLKTGDFVQITYRQKDGEGTTTVKPGDISSLALVMRIQADGSQAKY